MKLFEEGKRYINTNGENEIIVDRRTAKYLVIGMKDGLMKWAYIRKNDETEYLTIDAGTNHTAENEVVISEVPVRKTRKPSANKSNVTKKAALGKPRTKKAEVVNAE